MGDSRLIAEQFGMEVCTELPTPQLPPEMWERVPYAFVKRHTVLPLKETPGGLLTAVADPLNLEALDELRLMLDRPIVAIYCPKELLLTAIQGAYRDGGSSASELLADMAHSDAKEEEVEVYDLLDRSESAPIIRLINVILTEAIDQGASDIHFEPLENDLRVRYRIDGVLQNRHSPPSEYQTQLLTRLKVMARLDIAEHRLPQDGRIKLRLGGREVDLRVSTLPVSNGERIVLRILDKGSVSLGLDKMGMASDLLEALRKLIHLPEGILLVTGPTGSGKTTTLYSALTEVYTDEINIMTIEDPVEYKLRGIAQIGVRPKIGLTFAAGLRHILRQDPDVIMVGEVRDKETAEIAIQASLTGHLVLTTLHTNDAPSALTRLVDMGIEPYLLSSSVVGVLAQRLVRTICPHCKERYEASVPELGLERETLFRGKGCEECFHSGYKGRHGIYELMPVNHAIKKQIAMSADALQLRQLALDEGMVPLAHSGVALVRAGVTTPSEVLRVTRGI
jgi:general secretion pathway protein E